MQVIIGSEIRVKDADKRLQSWCTENLIISSPEYTNRKRRGLWTGNTPEHLWLYRVDGSDLILPVGTGKEIPLYDYQKTAVAEIALHSCGILQSLCGFGKTQMGIALAARLSRRTLWITHTQDLLNQSYERAAQYFPSGLLGRITAGKVQIGSHMTFATVQTMSKLDLFQYRYIWDTGIKVNRNCLDTDGTLEYGKLIPYLTGSVERNQEIVNELVRNAVCYNLVLSDRLEHLRAMMQMLPKEQRLSAMMIDGSMTSKAARAARIQAIEDMRNGNKHFLFASYSLAKEGLDIPRLDRLYLTTPKKDYAVVTQSIRRIARVFQGKTDALCYDYVDDIAFCQNQYKRRRTHYRKAGCII